MKTCFKCRRSLPYDEFYVHNQMADGRLGKCKDCTKRDVRERYKNDRSKVEAYDKARKAGSPKVRAQSMARNAVARGKLIKGPCADCGTTERIHGHHEDYSKPLDVVWLCPRHHGDRHRRGFYPSRADDRVNPPIA